MKKALFIVNLKSGKNQIRPYFGDIVNLLVADGYEVIVHTTQGVRDAAKAAAQRGGDCDLVVCAGGDGTLDEVVSGLLTLPVRPPIGYIPAGTTNDFARTLGISANMMSAAANVIKGIPYAVDIGHFNSRTFTYVAAFGAFTDVSYQTPQDMKNTLGHLAYLIEGLKSLPTITPYHMTVNCDGRIYTDDFAYGMVSNSISVGGIRAMSEKDMSLDDGLFEMTLIRMPKNILDLQQIMTAFLAQLPEDRLLIRERAKQVTFTCENGTAWTLDGEDGGRHKRAVLSNEQRAIQIIRPRNADEIRKVQDEYVLPDLKLPVWLEKKRV